VHIVESGGPYKQFRPLPENALGLGLRPVHYHEIIREWPEVDYFEIIAENFLEPGTRARDYLRQISKRYPVVMHSLGLNLLGSDELREDYIDALARLADELNAPFVSDHLCWTGYHGVHHHDLLPTPYVESLVDFAAERACYVQSRLDRPFGLENLSSYVQFRESTMSESDFYARVIREAGCWAMLDINNIYVSSQNHGFSAHDYIERIDFSRVLQVHLAGHTREPSGIIVDTHDQPIAADVWALYAMAYRDYGAFPTLIEWDANIPSLATLLQHLARAKEVRQ
jgi:uncharacterized protein (UPF0276 family)